MSSTAISPRNPPLTVPVPFMFTCRSSQYQETEFRTLLSIGMTLDAQLTDLHLPDIASFMEIVVHQVDTVTDIWPNFSEIQASGESCNFEKSAVF